MADDPRVRELRDALEAIARMSHSYACLTQQRSTSCAVCRAEAILDSLTPQPADLLRSDEIPWHEDD